MSVQEPKNLAEYNALVTGAGDRLVVVDFSAKWCGPCKRIAPIYAELATRHPDVLFLKVDVDEAKDIAGACGIRSMPTFWFLRRSQQLEQFSGADENRLQATIARLTQAAPAAGAPAAAGGAAPVRIDLPGGQLDITAAVTVNQCACLNQDQKHPVKNLFEGTTDYLASDCDEQLLIFVPFQQTVKLHSLKFDAPPVMDNAAKDLKLFVDQPNLDFDQADRLPAAQELSLTPDDFKKLVPLKFVKFQKVNSLTIFVKSNQGNKSTTMMARLRFIGTPVQTTNMSQFQRVAGKAGETEGGLPGMPPMSRDPSGL